MPFATILFACLHNAGRSQMAAALFNDMADPLKAVAISAGTDPVEAVYPAVITVMRELGIDLSGRTPRLLTEDMAQNVHLLITMGCGEACPHVSGLPREEWPLEDPDGLPMERVRRMQEILLTRVTRLIDTHGWK